MENFLLSSIDISVIVWDVTYWLSADNLFGLVMEIFNVPMC